MKVLAFDTSTTLCAVALYDSAREHQSIISIQEDATMQQGKLILPLIKAVLTSHSIALDELDFIAYGCGPGSFTGLRIACSVAQALSYAHQIPVISLSSLAIFAEAAHLKHKAHHVMVAVDARMDEIYWAVYCANKAKHMELIDQEAVYNPEKIRLEKDDNFLSSEHKKWFAVGDGWIKYRHILQKNIKFQPEIIDNKELPIGEAMITLARNQNPKEYLSSTKIIPNYLR